MAPAQQVYRPDIDGLRAISILLVVLYHGFPKVVPGGFIGVDVFFVISGYLITSQIYGQTKAGSFSFLSFYARRIRRIFPPLIAVLIFVGVYGYFRLNLNDFTQLYKHIAAGSVFISNFVLWQEAGYFDQQSSLKPLLHLWSLAIEEQFYLLWPLLVVALTAVSRRYQSILTWTLLLLCAASFVAGAHLAEHDIVAAFYSPLSRFWELGLGGLLAVWQMNRVVVTHFDWGRRAGNIAAAAACTALIACALLLTDNNHFPSLLTTLPALCALIIIAAGPDSITNRELFASAPMVQLGLISYALYLWHWPLLSLLRIEKMELVSSAATWLALAASVALAVLTRAILENPIRNNSARGMSIWLVAAFTFIGIVGIIGYKTELFRPQRMLLQAQVQEQMKAASREPNVFNTQGIPSSDCAELLPPDSPALRNCRIWGSANAKHTVAVWGDSMSAAWLPPFFALIREQGWRVLQFSHSGCPPLVGVHRTASSNFECSTPMQSAKIVEAIRSTKPEVVFLIARWNLYYHGHIRNDILVDKSFITDGAGDANADTARKSFRKRMPETIKRVSELSRLVIFKDTPVLKVPTDVGISTRPDTFEPRVSEMKRFEAEINQVIDAAVADAPNAVAFDPSVRLCGATKCSAYLDGLPAYFDEVHPTPHATMQFLPDIESLGAAR